MARKQYRPGRKLLVFFAGVAVLFVLVALGGTWKPVLGLDLQGGTRITLIATGSPKAESLAQARQIIDQRVNGSGVAEADVTVLLQQHAIFDLSIVEERAGLVLDTRGVLAEGDRVERL